MYKLKNVPKMYWNKTAIMFLRSTGMTMACADIMSLMNGDMKSVTSAGVTAPKNADIM